MRLRARRAAAKPTPLLITGRIIATRATSKDQEDEVDAHVTLQSAYEGFGAEEAAPRHEGGEG